MNYKKEYGAYSVSNGEEFCLESQNAFNIVFVKCDDSGLHLKEIRESQKQEYLDKFDRVVFCDGIILKAEDNIQNAYFVYETAYGDLGIAPVYEHEQEMEP